MRSVSTEMKYRFLALNSAKSVLWKHVTCLAIQLFGEIIVDLTIYYVDLKIMCMVAYMQQDDIVKHA